MSRSKTYGLALALIASAALSTACTRSDTTGPSDQTQASSRKARAKQLNLGDGPNRAAAALEARIIEEPQPTRTPAAPFSISRSGAAFVEADWAELLQASLRPR